MVSAGTKPVLLTAVIVLRVSLAGPAWMPDDLNRAIAHPASQPSPIQLSPQDQKEANALLASIWDLRERAHYAETVQLAQRLMELHAHAQGRDHWETHDAMQLLARLRFISTLPPGAQAELAEADRMVTALHFFRARDFRTASEMLGRRIEIRTRWLGSDDDEIAVDMMYRGFAIWEGENDLAAAERWFRQVLAIRRRIHQGDHPHLADDIHNLAVILEARGDYGEATALLRESLAIRRRILSPWHRELATSCARLGELLLRRGEYAAAEPLLREAIFIAHQAPGEKVWRNERRDMAAGAVRSLGLLLEARGDDAGAEWLFRESLAIRQVLLNEGTALMGALLKEAGDLEKQGRTAEAHDRSLRASTMQRRLCFQGAEVSLALGDMARVLQGQGKLADARQAYEEALKERRTLPDMEEVETQALNDLASLLAAGGEYEMARELCGRALALRRRLYGQEHPDIARALHDLACLRHMEGRFEEARELYVQSLAMQLKLLGPDHPDVLQSRGDIARLLYDQGDYEQAESAWLEAARGFETARLRVSAAGLERVPFAAARSPLLPLAACQARNGRHASACEHLEGGLARGLLDSLSERKLRPLTAEQRALEERLLGRLGKLDGQITVVKGILENDRPVSVGILGLLPEGSPGELNQLVPRSGHAPAEVGASRPSGEDRRNRMELLARLQKEHAELAAEYAGFEREVSLQYGVRAGKVYELAEIQARLAPGEAMLTWVDVAAHSGAKDANGEHWACVVRRAGGPRWVRLPGSGAGGAWTGEDDRLPQRGRDLLGTPVSARGELAGVLAALYRQRIVPVEECLKAEPGGPAVRHLIVLPAGWMAAIPVEALTDRYTISYAPSGTMYAWLREQGRSGEARPEGTGLLALGDPVFEAPEGQERPVPAPPALDMTVVKTSPKASAEAGAEQRLDALLRATRGAAFTPLPGTRAEVEAIARLWQNRRPSAPTTILLGSAASEQQLDGLAGSGRLRQFRFIHLATHAVMDDRAPMQSVLILSQDRPEDQLEQVLAGREAYDGRLTADQISRSWRLNAELVTLSGCHTALGKASGGEGYLGFSQALFVAGARSLLLSLWKADDTATSLLMIRFYGNLLGGGAASEAHQAPASPLTKAQALREAQHWLRGLTAEQVRRLCAEYSLPLPSTLARGEAGRMAAADLTSRSFEHPYYWSAFVLIGDPE